MLELQAASPADQARYRCSSCPEATQRLRRCREDRWDLGGEDGAIFPLYVSKGGALYGFCPGKATWDPRVTSIYQALVVCSETGLHWQAGGLADQPAWWVELVAEFLPQMAELRFAARARAILGDSSSSSKGAAHGNLRQGSRIQNQGGRG